MTSSAPTAFAARRWKKTPRLAEGFSFIRSEKIQLLKPCRLSNSLWGNEEKTSFSLGLSLETRAAIVASSLRLNPGADDRGLPP
ncbi:hypothetical protein [Achromobacter sp. UMC46]|uniref:hypothetical protein n=1 Tax=Achromobacter sp. UMC46 TaxID=1862319 RepID=UPI0015FF8324|nr:hypothetical protein [Achromobacter sp. UMC46]